MQSAKKMSRTRTMAAALALLLLLSFGVAAIAQYDADSTRILNVAQAAELYGAACSGWDEDGDGCGANCQLQCHAYQSSSFYHDVYGNLGNGNCTVMPGSGGIPGSCGVFENVDQTQCQ